MSPNGQDFDTGEGHRDLMVSQTYILALGLVENGSGPRGRENVNGS